MKLMPPLHLEDVPGGPDAGTLIATLDDIPEHGGKDVIFTEGRHRINIFIQKYGGVYHVFENRCPHAGTRLNLFGDRFLNLDGNALLCRTHGALFNPESGICTLGPCKKQSLRKIAFTIKDGALYTA